MATDRPVKWAIEDSFPIVEINRLAVPERSSFKAIYQMHKWFARRASCVFRAILLGALKPLPLDEKGNPTKSGAEVIMEEFYKNHTHDPDTNGKVILDPFMGGGTTVVEALRLGCKVIGIDLNPVAWFIVKTEVEPVDVKQLQRAFEDLEIRSVPWSEKPLKHTLLDLYKTTCPCCANPDADIIYSFWVRSAVCTNQTCGKLVPLFTDYVVAAKQPSIRYFQDVRCPECSKTFDWELEPASLIAESTLSVVNSLDGAGLGRGNIRWSCASREPVICPWCSRSVAPALGGRSNKPARKKVLLSVLLCPHCQGVWQFRGTVPDSVACPLCNCEYSPATGNVPTGGKFVCPSCGTIEAVIKSVRSLSGTQRLPYSQYAMQGHCRCCANLDASSEDDSRDGLLSFDPPDKKPDGRKNTCKDRCLLRKSSGKFYKRIEPNDLSRFKRIEDTWNTYNSSLPSPQSEIPFGEKTKTHLLGHHFTKWAQLFNARQLLAISSLLRSIDQEPSQQSRELLLCAFSNMLEANNVFTRQITARKTPGGTPPAGIFARHDFHPKMTYCEQNVWGGVSGNNTFVSRIAALYAGVEYANATNLSVVSPDGDIQSRPSNEVVAKSEDDALLCGDARQLVPKLGGVTHVITDPPYADNVNYAELSDFFYVWLRLVLRHRYAEFTPEYTPKQAEIVENTTRGFSAHDFETGLKDVFASSRDRLAPDGLLVFTFHHAGGNAWESLLRAMCESGFVCEAVYPIHAEREASLHLLDQRSIAYDLIHVCRRIVAGASREQRSWAGMRQEIRRRARNEIDLIEAGRYGSEPLSPADVNIILIGKCLELYSRHYGHVVDHEGRSVPLREALEAIRMEVDQLVSQEQPLPSELADIDPVSYVYLVCLADRTVEIKSDELHKYTRGVLEPDELIEAGLIIKGRAGRGRHFEIKSPSDRFASLQEKFGSGDGAVQAALPGMEDVVNVEGSRQRGIFFIDYVHYLIALTEGGENLRPWLERFRGLTPQLRAACTYLKQRQSRFAMACDKLLKFLDVSPLFKGASGS